MTNPVLSFFGAVAGGLIKWVLIAALWLASIVFVASTADALEVISGLLSGFKAFPTPYLDQKTTIETQQKELNRKRVEVKRHGKKVRNFSSKMAVRNVADASTSLIPIAGGVLAVSFSVADVYAACELVTMQNELEAAFGFNGELSKAESACSTSVEKVDELGRQAEATLVEMKQTGQEVSTIVREYWADQLCRVTGDC